MLELLVVLALMAMLIVLLGSGLRLAAGTWQRQEALVELHADLDPVQGILREMLSAARFLAGDAVSLSFVGRMPRSLADDRLQEMVLAVEGSTLRLRWRAFLRGRTAPAPFRQVDLATDVRGLEIGYFGSIGEQAGRAADVARVWEASWSVKDGPPGLVRLRLLLSAGDLRAWPDLVVAPRIDAPPVPTTAAAS